MGKKRVGMKEVRDTDDFLRDPKEGDLVIAVIGPTGAGKSTFINTLFGQDVAPVGHQLNSHTDQINHYFLKGSDPRIVLVDTPGFDDTDVNDRDILRRITVWLARSYNTYTKLAGIIYLHGITEARMLGLVRKNKKVYDKLCGTDAAKVVILATTKWAYIKPDVGKRREQQLRYEYWTEMLARGSWMTRFEYTKSSAETIIRAIRARKTLHTAQIEDEFTEIDEILAENDTIQTQRLELIALFERQKNLTVRLHQESGDDVHQKILGNHRSIRSIMWQIKELSVPFSREMINFFGLLDHKDPVLACHEKDNDEAQKIIPENDREIERIKSLDITSATVLEIGKPSLGNPPCEDELKTQKLAVLGPPQLRPPSEYKPPNIKIKSYIQQGRYTLCVPSRDNGYAAYNELRRNEDISGRRHDHSVEIEWVLIPRPNSKSFFFRPRFDSDESWTQQGEPYVGLAGERAERRSVSAWVDSSDKIDWYATKTSQEDEYYIRSVNGDFAMSMHGGDDRNPKVILQKFDENNTYQIWRLKRIPWS